MVWKTSAASLLATLSLAAPALAAPTVSGISPQPAPRSSPLHITGSGFGAAKGASAVTIDGRKAFTTRWTDTDVTAYVPAGATIGTDALAITVGGVTASAPVDVSGGPGGRTGKISWRFKTEASYTGQPAVAADGTVYVSDSSGFLYALGPAGNLKWIYNASADGGGGDPVSVGQDGTVYLGVSGIHSSVHAVNPNGTRRWRWVDPAGSQGPMAGPTVGPDGNVYAVFDQPTATGAISWTPAGAVRWTNPGNPKMLENAQIGKHVAFGAGNAYFGFDEQGVFQTPLMYALRMSDGHQQWTAQTGNVQGAATDSAGNVYWAPTPSPRVVSYSPAGAFRWSQLDNEQTPTNVISDPTVGPDDTVYSVRNDWELWALTPAGAKKWLYLDPQMLFNQVVSPDDSTVLAVGREGFGNQGMFLGVGRADGSLRFRQTIPFDAGGLCPVPYGHPTWAPNSVRAYFSTTIGCQTPARSFNYLYAIDTTNAFAGPVAVAGLTLYPFTVHGGQTSDARVTLRAPAPAGGTVVIITDSNPSAATAPSSVTIPAGAQQARFTVTAKPTCCSTFATFTARANGTSQSAQLSIVP